MYKLNNALRFLQCFYTAFILLLQWFYYDFCNVLQYILIMVNVLLKFIITKKWLQYFYSSWFNTQRITSKVSHNGVISQVIFIVKTRFTYFSVLTKIGMNNFNDRDIREVIKKRDPNYAAFSLATCELQLVFY